MKSLLAIISLIAISISQSQASEPEQREQLQFESSAAFQKSDFARLEQLAKEYRSSKARTDSGTWHLSMFYKGIARRGLEFGKTEHEAWESALSKFDDWIEAFPDSPTPHIARAATYMGRAWIVRGESYVQGVSGEERDWYRKLATRTGEYLAAHQNLNSEDPHWYYLMADVYRALGAEKQAFWDLITDGLDAYPDYDDILFVAGGFYSPRWYGSSEEVERLAQMVLEKTRSSRGFEAYARIYWVAGKLNSSTYMFQGPNANWTSMVKGMDDTLSRYPSQWNIQHFLVFACAAEDHPTSKRYFNMITKRLVSTAWQNIEKFRTCEKFVKAS